MGLMLNGVLGFLLGAVVGSFAATVLVRWPQGRAVSRGRSSCDRCQATLGPLELVPVLSFIIQRGRCRRCGGSIDARHVAVELAAGVTGAVAFIAHPLPLALATAVLGWWLLLIACLDFEHHWLPDALTLPLVPAGLAVAYAGIGPSLVDRAVGAAVAAAALWLIARAYRLVRRRDGMGAGDWKLFAGLGAWLGWTTLPFVLLGASILGLAAAILMRARGGDVSGATRLPLGTLLAVAAWPLWLLNAAAAPILFD